MNNFVTEQVIENAIIQELLFQTDLESVCTELISNAHQQQIDEMMVQLKRELAESNQLKPIQELFEFFLALKEQYVRYIQYLESHEADITHNQIKEIMVGIKIMFEGDLEGFLSMGGINADDEVDAFLKQASKNLEDAMNIRKEHIQKVVLEGYIEAGYVDMIMRQNISEMCRTSIEEANHIVNAYKCDINDLSKRPLAKGYVDFLHKQDKTMAMLNLIQMDVIHHEVKEPLERGVLEKLAYQIEEIYQIIAGKVSEITDFIDQLKPYESLEDYSEEIERCSAHMFEHIINSIQYKDAIAFYLRRRNELIKTLFVAMTDEIERANDVSIKALNKNSQDIQLISCKITDSVKSLDTNLQSLFAYLKETEDFYQIVIGIIDTISLKLSALRDKDYEYMLTKQNNIVNYEKMFFDFANDIKNKFEDYFHIMLDEDRNIFLEKQNSYKRMYEDVIQKAKQVDMDYLKYNLLFEVVTLEEILNHSLPKLEKYDHTICQQTIKIVEKAYDEIQSLLKKFNLTIIDPVPGDRFNGKIHEVTVVEASDTYKKGQIIKMETRGYIYKNTPVVRAHVVVAK